MPVQKKPLPRGVGIAFTAIEGPGEGLRYPVKNLPAYIGSGEYADILLPKRGVSESHARLSMKDDGLYLEDLGTGGVTKVNDLSAKSFKLASGDIVEIGEVKLLAHITLPESMSKGAGDFEDEVKPVKSSRAWLAGFDTELRDWFKGTLAAKHQVETRAFANGEEVLKAASDALGRDQAPGLAILDLRMPIINGINVAVATRAFELGFNRKDRINIVFLFDPPGSSSFEKVLSFCQPARVVTPGASEGDKQAAIDSIVKNLLRKPG